MDTHHSPQFAATIEAARDALARGAWEEARSPFKGLMKLLALAPGHREQLVERLWTGSDPKAAANNLRQALHAVRRILEPDPVIASCHRDPNLDV